MIIRLLWLFIVIIGANSPKPINTLATIQKAFVVHWINCWTKHFRFYPTFYPIATTVKFCLYLAGFEMTTTQKGLDKRRFLFIFLSLYHWWSLLYENRGNIRFILKTLRVDLCSTNFLLSVSFPAVMLSSIHAPVQICLMSLLIRRTPLEAGNIQILA